MCFLRTVLRDLLLLLLATQINCVYIRLSSSDLMKCSYGERGSLTATCVNATGAYFRNTPYRFDHLDETLRCLNCSLHILDPGVFDISGNQIKNLDLTNDSVNTIRQRAFVGLIFLEKLTLADNQIKAIYPGTFMGVKKIVDIDLSNNSLTMLNDDGFSELINLQRLNLRNNLIGVVQSQAFSGLEKLEALDLSKNSISKIHGIFNNLTALKILDLRDNKISELNGKDFSNVTSLAELKFSNNYIKTIPSGEFIELRRSLKKIDLSYNLISNIVAGSFRELSILTDLDISNNNIPEIPQKAFQSLHGLHILNLSNNKISTFETGLYSGLPQLRILNVSQNSIEEIEITGVFSLHSLHTLDLSSNNIDDLDYVALVERIPRLSYLDLKDNLLPCDLESEMLDYFAEDNFKFELFRNELGATKCVEYPRNATIKNFADKVVREKSLSRNNNSSNIWLIVMVCIILVFVAILYYMQFMTYKEMRNNSFGSRRSTSEAQLISSDLEAGDNDYLKE